MPGPTRFSLIESEVTEVVAWCHAVESCHSSAGSVWRAPGRSVDVSEAYLSSS